MFPVFAAQSLMNHRPQALTWRLNGIGCCVSWTWLLMPIDWVPQKIWYRYVGMYAYELPLKLIIGLQTDPSIWDLAPNIHSVTTRYPTQNLPKNNKSSSGFMKCQKPSPCPEQNFWSIFGYWSRGAPKHRYLQHFRSETPFSKSCQIHSFLLTAPPHAPNQPHISTVFFGDHLNHWKTMINYEYTCRLLKILKKQSNMTKKTML